MMNDQNDHWRLFGLRLRDARRASGLGQHQLAVRVGVHHSYISKIENGRLPPPAARTIQALAAVTGADAAALLDAANKPPVDVLTARVAQREAQLAALWKVLQGVPGPALEAMAAAEHTRWAGWYRWQRDHSTPDRIAHWNQVADTPYADLPENLKQKDRDQVLYALAAARTALGSVDSPGPERRADG